MLRVGLTGSIAVGKSFVSSVLAELGCPVIDADAVARDVVAPGGAGLRAIVAEFGEEILGEDGALDRARLGKIVFADKAKREILNQILHPLIFKAQDARLREIEERSAEAVAVVDAALMIESGGYRRFDKLIVVHCRPEIQLERLMKRDRLTEQEATARISAQMPQTEKMRYADYLIDTSNGFTDTQRQTEEVYAHLVKAARSEKS